MVETRGFRGKLNLDDNEYRVPVEDYLDAVNVTRDAQQEGSDESLTNVIGNLLVSDNLPPGKNVVIGNYADKVRSRIYYFTWNENGFHRISYYDLSSNSIVVLIEDKTDSDGVPILNFNLDFRINHVDIIYRDEEGDLLFWTDGLNPPSKINVSTIFSGTLLPLKRSYLDVAKEPPSAPPYAAYNDYFGLGKEINRLRNKLFKFKYRFVFDDLEKSVFSSICEVPLPYNNNNNSLLPEKNGIINILLQSGNKNVTKIELAGAVAEGDNYSDFFLIDVYDKSLLNISDNSIFLVTFRNDRVYLPISVRESIQPFDNVPQTAYTQSLPNGNVLDYGLIKEGYDLVDVTGYLINDGFPSPPLYPTAAYNSLVVAAYQNELPAFGSGEIKIYVIGLGRSGQLLNINTNISNLVNISAFGDPTQIILNIQSAAISAGFTILSVDANSITIDKPGVSLVSVALTKGDSLNFLESTYAWDWASEYGLGIVYFDDKGRTNGVQPFNKLTDFVNKPQRFITRSYIFLSGLLGVPYVNIILSNKPPIWANYFQLVRTKNLTKSKWVYWATNNTIKDNNPDLAGNKYAYLSISTLINYVSINPNTPLGYEFTPGDRVIIINRVDSNGNLVNQYSEFNYNIESLVTNPVVNGTQYKGQYLQIFLPSNLTVDFNFGTGYENYFIQIYTPSQNFSSDLNVYYEFGQRYIIGDPGTEDRTYQAGYSIQQEGDSYLRKRKIPLGGNAIWKAETQNITADQVIALSLTLDNTNSIYYNGRSSANVTAPGSYIIERSLIPIPVGTNVQLQFNGEITLEQTGGGLPRIVFEIMDGNTIVISYNVPLGVIPTQTPTTISIPNTLVNLYGSNVDGIRVVIRNFVGKIVSMELNANQDSFLETYVNDQNLSDVYSSASSPNGRTWVFDPNALQTSNPTLIRFGGEFQPGTNVNEINRFYEENFDVYDRSRGAIKKMFIEGRNQYIFQEFDVGVVTVLTQIVRDTATNPLSAESDRLLNKIVYPYIGGYGIGNVPESFAYGKSAKYFIDNNKGVVCRLSADGITPLSITYKTNAFFVPKLAEFNYSLNNSTALSGRPTIFGAFDAYTNKYMIALEQINRDGFYQQPYTISFLESRDNKQGFESFLTFYPENIGALNNLFVSFKDGYLYTHNNPVHCEFYGIRYPSYIDVVFNQNQITKKYFLSIFETSNAIWYCPTIKSQLNSYGSTKQETSLVPARFTLLEGQYASAILRDQNSIGGIINGDKMHGNYLIIRFQIDNNTGSLIYLNSVSLMYKESPLNLR